MHTPSFNGLMVTAMEFYKKFLGVYFFPQPWKLPPDRSLDGLMPIFIPAGVTVFDVIEKVISPLGFRVIEEASLDKFTGLESSPLDRLHLTQISSRPNNETLFVSATHLRKTRLHSLGLLDYMLAFGLNLFSTGMCLDDQTFTFFPDNTICNIGVARAKSIPSRKIIQITWNSERLADPKVGSRIITRVPHKTDAEKQTIEAILA